MRDQPEAEAEVGEGDLCPPLTHERAARIGRAMQGAWPLLDLVHQDRDFTHNIRGLVNILEREASTLERKYYEYGTTLSELRDLLDAIDRMIPPETILP